MYSFYIYIYISLSRSLIENLSIWHLNKKDPLTEVK